MSILKSAVNKTLAAPTIIQSSNYITSNGYRGATNGANGFWMFNVNGNGYDQYFSINGNSAPLKAFQECPPVSGILTQKAHAYLNGVTSLLNKDNKPATSAEATKVAALLKKPNPVQTGAQFEMQVYVNTMLYGYTVILPIRAAGFENIEAKQLWAVPGNMIEIKESDEKFFDFTNTNVKIISEITLVYKNTRIPLPINDLFIIKDITPSFDSIALPQSRIVAQQQPINNIIGAFKSRGVLISNRGPKYVVSNGSSDKIGTIPMTPDEKTDMENQFKYRFGLMPDQSQAIISSASLDVQSIGFNVKELGLMEEVQDSSSMLCIGIGFPKFLAGLSDPTFNNQDTAEKALYQRFIIPESISFYEQWNMFFNTAKYNFKLVKDYTALPVLQEDRINLGRGRYYMNMALIYEWYNNIITANEWLQANGQPAKDGFDKYYYEWAKEGRTFGILPSGNQAPNDVSANSNNSNSTNQNSNNGNNEQ